jgi:twinkle protein
MSEQTWADLGIDIPYGRHGDVKTQCPKCGVPGQRTNWRDRSLSVNVDSGLFRCHYCGWKGKLGGGDGPSWGRISPPKVYRKPEPVAVNDLSDGAVQFFTDRR